MENLTVDRIFDGIAVCLTSAGAVRRIDVAELPEGVAEGTVLVSSDGALSIDAEKTAAMQAHIAAELFYEHEDGSPAMREGMEG